MAWHENQMIPACQIEAVVVTEEEVGAVVEGEVGVGVVEDEEREDGEKAVMVQMMIMLIARAKAI